MLLVTSRSYAEPALGLRAPAAQGERDTSRVLGPAQNPEGWKLMPEVVVQHHLKAGGVGTGRMNGGMNVETGLKVGLWPCFTLFSSSDILYFVWSSWRLRDRCAVPFYLAQPYRPHLI